VKARHRISITPATVIALVALFFALGGSALAVGERMQAAAVAQQRCTTGAVRGIAVVTGDPKVGIANLSDKFTTARVVFSRRFNCTGKAVQVRRAGLGVYEVRFPGVTGGSAVANTLGGFQTAVEPLPDGGFRVSVAPAAGSGDQADRGFTIVVV